ncbi:hypothetical protein D3C87_395020 [compost metagenome]
MADVCRKVVCGVTEGIGKHRCLHCVAAAHIKPGLLASPAQAQLQRGVGGRPAYEPFLPVGVAALIPGAVDIICRLGIVLSAVVGKGLPAHLKVLRRIHHVHPGGHRAEAVAGVDRERCFSSLSLLGRYKDHTIAAPGTVYGRGIGVLEYLDALDIVRVYGVEHAAAPVGQYGSCLGKGGLLADGDTVNDVQGKVPFPPQAVHPPDLNGESPSCNPSILGDVDTRHPSLDR